MSERADDERPRELPTVSAEHLDAVIFDLDGVITDTRQAHEAAWQQLFDEYRDMRAERGEGAYAPFSHEDYREHLDGKPRYDGVRDFLRSRGVELPWGDPGDDPDEETICGLGNRKNRHFQEWLSRNQVETYPDAISFFDSVRAAGLQTAIISASKNCTAVLENAGFQDRFDVQVDGTDMARLGLPGKPDPAIFLQAAERLGVSPARAAGVEDALAGVEAGRRGKFALVVGVDRTEDAAGASSLRDRGAHVVVGDLRKVLAEAGNREEEGCRPLDSVPLLWDRESEVMERFAGKQVAVFLDYDGTLTPIVDDYNRAIIDEDMCRTVEVLAELCPVAVVSGRDLNNVRNLVDLDTVFYAGSHGFEIAGPKGWHEQLQQGREFLPDLDAAESELRDAVHAIEGASVERKTFSIAAHYRKARKEDHGAIADAVTEVVERHARLRKSRGKMVHEVQPRTGWDKGHAVLWLLDRLDLAGPDVLPIYVGDDVTDEDAFKALREHDRGIGIAVRNGETRTTAAHFALADTEDVRRFLEKLITLMGASKE